MRRVKNSIYTLYKARVTNNALFIKLLFLSYLVFNQAAIVAQDINKDVTVTKAYKPVVADARKINQLPTFNDTVTIKPAINYTISTIKVNPVYSPRPVNAAKLVPEDLEPLQNGYIRMGLGYPLSPLAELYINNTRSKTNNIGFYAGHESMSGKVSLNDDNRVDAGYSFNKVQLFGKHIFKEFVLGGELGYRGDKNTFYGANNLTDYNALLHNTQQYHNGGLNMFIESNQTDSDRLYYKFNTGFNYLADRFSNTENSFKIEGSGATIINGFYSGADVKFNYYGQTSTSYNVYNSLMQLSPFIGKSRELWRFKAGFSVMPNFASEGGGMHFYPFGNLDFSVVPQVLMAYVGLDGKQEANPLIKSAYENAYLQPGLVIKNTNHRVRFYGGLKGDISSAVNFNLAANYSLIDDMYFWVNNTTHTDSANRFVVTYGDVELLKLTGEINIHPSEKINWYNNLNFYNYTLTRVTKAWHKPNVDFKSEVKYRLRDKIIVNIGLYGAFGRYAQGTNSTDVVELKPLIDFNFGIEYRYTKPLSVFVKFNNVSASRYEIWNMYPVYRFQVMGGFTYSL